MRWLVPIVVAWVALLGSAAAKPKVAVAPLDGDPDHNVSDVVAEEAAEHAKVTGPEQVASAMESLAITDVTSARALKKLRARLEVDAVVHGKVTRDGTKRRLALTVSGRGKRAVTFEVRFKTASSRSFRKELRDELAKAIAPADQGDARDDEATDADDEPKKQEAEADPPKKHAADDDPKPKHRETDEPKKRVSEEESGHSRKHATDDDDRAPSHKKHKRRRRADDELPSRHQITQSALWLDAGVAGLRRTLTYSASGTPSSPPPPVGTGSLSGQLEAEVYPAAFSTLEGPAAGIGFAGSIGKTVGLGIAVPGTTSTASINEGHYSIGARYRFVFGTSSIAAGLTYWRQHYIADRSSLAMPLDMPDVDYTAVAPGVLARVAAAPKVGVFLAVDVPLMLSTGPIGTPASLGRASVIAFAVDGGVDVALDAHYGLRFAAMLDQINFKFTGNPPSRGVTAATDRTMGIAATFAVIY